MKQESKAVVKHLVDCDKEIARLEGKVIAIKMKIALLEARKKDYKAVLERMMEDV